MTVEVGRRLRSHRGGEEERKCENVFEKDSGGMKRKNVGSLEELKKYWTRMGRNWPLGEYGVRARVGGVELEMVLPRLMEEVFMKRGGYDCVNEGMLWGEVRSALGLVKDPTSTNFALQRLYSDFILAHEREVRCHDTSAVRRPEVGGFIKVLLPVENGSSKTGWFWGCITSVHVLTGDVDVLFDNSEKLVRLSLYNVNYKLGYLCKHYKVYVAMSAKQPVLRYDPESNHYVPLRKETAHSSSTIEDELEEEEERPTPDDLRPTAGEVVRCCCGWNEAEGELVQCSVCRCWSHQYCAGEVDAVDNFACFACDPLHTKQNSFAAEVAQALLRVRSQSQWKSIGRQLERGKMIKKATPKKPVRRSKRR